MKKPKPQTFEEFWEAYPRKVGKGDARRRWKKINPSQELYEQIMKAVAAQKTSIQWNKDGGQFIPYPATWLHREGWDDEITKSPEDKMKREHLYIEQRKRQIREDYEDYLRDKSTAALKDIQKDGGQLVGIAGWLIDEILTETNPKIGQRPESEVAE